MRKHGNPRPDPSNLDAFDIGAVEYQHLRVVIHPVLTSIAPNSGVRGTAVNVTLTGTGSALLADERLKRAYLGM